MLQFIWDHFFALEDDSKFLRYNYCSRVVPYVQFSVHIRVIKNKSLEVSRPHEEFIWFAGLLVLKRNFAWIAQNILGG